MADPVTAAYWLRRPGTDDEVRAAWTEFVDGLTPEQQASWVAGIRHVLDSGPTAAEVLANIQAAQAALPTMAEAVNALAQMCGAQPSAREWMANDG